MGILSKESICLGAAAQSKRDAIRQCGKLLVDVGCVVPQYVDGMLGPRRDHVHLFGKRRGHSARPV